MYLKLEDLEVYKLATKISDIGWKIYQEFDWRIKKIIGDQFIESVDSVGANIAEGYGRFHYLDKIKFYYNAGGSLLEAKHWLNLLLERRLVDNGRNIGDLNDKFDKMNFKLNRFIGATFKAKNS